MTTKCWNRGRVESTGRKAYFWHDERGNHWFSAAAMPVLSPRATAANNLLKQKLEERCTNLTAAFRKVDKSNNGFITPADFSEVMASFGIRVTRPSLMAIVAKYDANGDGFVSYEEFCATMAGTSNPGLAAAPKIAAPAATSRAEEAIRRTTTICAAYAPCLH